MGAMLGVALSDNVLTLFVFWELTGFTSFLLIGFEHERRRRTVGRSAGIDRDRRRRPRAARRRRAALRCVRRPRVCRRWRRTERRSWRIRSTPPSPMLDVARRIHKVRAGAVSFLAAERDGRPDARQRLSPLGDDGQSRRVSRREDDADSWRDPLWTTAVTACRRGDDGGRRIPVRAGNGSQTHPRVLDRECAGCLDDAARRRHARGDHGRAGLPGRTRVLQGRAIPGRRRDRPRDREHATSPRWRGYAGPCR